MTSFSINSHLSPLATTTVTEPWLPRRQKLWQIGGGLQCSVIGTCLSHEDLLRIARKYGLRWTANVLPYDVHGFFVKEAGTPSNIAAALQKLLDKRYASIITRLERCMNDTEREQLWQQELTAGRVAGAYWAFISDQRVSRELFTRIFGEVHMLSHMQGRVAHQTLTRLSELQSENDHLESKVLRLSARNRELAAERDAALLAASIARAQSVSTPRASLEGSDAKSKHVRKPEERHNRALIAARQRARGAERRLKELEDQLQRLKLLLGTRSAAVVHECPAAVVCEAAIRADVERRVLYIGGRSGMTDHLRRIASRHQAELLHHDGGIERAVSRIDSTIEGCDAVFCPIDCVSHAACLKAKAICKRLQKPFIPLRSSGAATFERALSNLVRG